MQNKLQKQTDPQGLTLVIGGTGKTGRRIVDRLAAHGRPVRVGSRSGEVPFDWDRPETWSPALDGVSAVYVTYAPDLSVPGAPEAIEGFTTLAKQTGVARIVLLSGRGEVEAQRCEVIVQRSGIDWTVVRAGWFNQNFNEGAFLDLVRSGVVRLPAGEAVEPFVDVDDIADVAVAALTEAGHANRVYEVTGPRLMTMAEAVEAVAQAAGVSVKYQPVTMDEFRADLAEHGVPEDYIGLLTYLFGEMLHGHNAFVADGVRQALGRGARDFVDYAAATARTGVWAETGKAVAS
ncbi:MAG: NAD(P)H-binding protein [Planctomycetota bacterium]